MMASALRLGRSPRAPRRGDARRWRFRACALLAAFAFGTPAAFASDGADPHAHHHHAAPEAVRTTAAYAVPDVELVRDDGAKVSLRRELDDGRPVVLSFVFTSCTTICPVISATLAQVQRKLGSDRDRVHIVSISIDPEYDTPARLREYARKFNAGPEWQHYGGTVAASQAVQRALGAFRGEKMDHAPATLVRATPGGAWVRLDGFASADQILRELPALHASR